MKKNLSNKNFKKWTNIRAQNGVVPETMYGMFQCLLITLHMIKDFFGFLVGNAGFHFIQLPWKRASIKELNINPFDATCAFP